MSQGRAFLFTVYGEHLPSFTQFEARLSFQVSFYQTKYFVQSNNARRDEQQSACGLFHST